MIEGPTLFDQEALAPSEPEPFDPTAVGEHIAAHASEDPYAEVNARARRIVEGRGEDLRAEQVGLTSDSSPVVGPGASRAILRSKGPRREPTIGDQVIEYSKERLNKT